MYQSSRYITDRFLPDKAIDLLDEAGARAKLREAGYSEEFGEINKQHPRRRRADGERRLAEGLRARAVLSASRKRWRARTCSSCARSSTCASSARRVMVGRPEIDEVVSKWTGVPLTSINEDEGDKLLRMEEELHARVISQEKAISARVARHPPVARRASRPRRVPSAASCSSGRPASARPSWRGRWRTSCSAATTRSSASTCPSTWRSTRSRS